MQNLVRLFRHLSVLALTVSVAACVDGSDGDWNDADDPDGDANGDEVVLHDDVVLVEDSPCFVEVDVPEDRVELRFDFSCDVADLAIEPGKIVVGATGGGYLRRVLSVTSEGATLVVLTEEASLSEAVVQGSLSETLTELGDRSLINLGNTTLFSGDIGPSSAVVRLDTGYIDIDPVFVMTGHWSDGSVERFQASMGLGINGDLSASISSTNGLRYGTSKTLSSYSWPFAAAVGPLPVVGTVNVKVKAGFRVDAPGQVSIKMGAAGALDYRTENKYRRTTGWSSEEVAENTWALRPPEFNISSHASARVYIRLELSVALYGVVGPSSSNTLYISTKAKPTCAGIDWKLNSGFSSRVNVKLNILDKFTPTKTFAKVNFTAELDSGVIPWPLNFPLPCGQEEIRCNEKVSGDTSVGYSAELSGYSCNVGNYDSPEAIWKWVAPSTQTVNWTLLDAVPTATNHDVMVLDGAWGLVTADCMTWGSNSIEFEAEEGKSYYLVIDGYDEDAGPFGAQLECSEEGSNGAGSGELPFNPF